MLVLLLVDPDLAATPGFRALSMLWHLGAALPLWPSPARKGDLRDLADRVRKAGILTGVDFQERLDAADTGWLGAQRPRYPAAAADHTSRLSRPVRRQLACVGALSATELPQGLLRARPGYRDPARRALRLEARGAHAAATQRPVILELVRAGQAASRGDILARLVTDGLPPASASLWLVRCPWLRPAGQRAVFRRAGLPATTPAPGRPPCRQRRPRGMSAR